MGQEECRSAAVMAAREQFDRSLREHLRDQIRHMPLQKIKGFEDWVREITDDSELAAIADQLRKHNVYVHRHLTANLTLDDATIIPYKVDCSNAKELKQYIDLEEVQGTMPSRVKKCFTKRITWRNLLNSNATVEELLLSMSSSEKQTFWKRTTPTVRWCASMFAPSLAAACQTDARSCPQKSLPL